MRRFGIPILLCSAYILTMMLVFSSDYGKESPLFPPDNQPIAEQRKKPSVLDTTFSTAFPTSDLTPKVDGKPEGSAGAEEALTGKSDQPESNSDASRHGI